MKFLTMFASLLLLLLLDPSAAQSDSSDGTSFAVTFPPQKSDLTIGECYIYVNAKTPSTVTVEHAGISDTYPVYPNATLEYQVGCMNRTLEGIEDNKVFYVTSDYPVSATAYHIVQTDQMDAILLSPITASSTEFVTVMYVNPNGYNYDCGTSSNTAAYYVISGVVDGTTVEVYAPGDSLPKTTLSLNRNQAYTNRTTLGNIFDDLSGYYIVADNVVAVTSGSACTHYSDDLGDDSGVTWSSLPPVAALRDGLHISYEPEWSSEYYTVMVVASADGTSVNVDGSAIVLNRGEKFSVEKVSETAQVDCSLPCLVSQVHRNYLDQSGIFQTVVTPVSEYNTYTLLYSPETVDPNTPKYVRVVTTSSNPYGILINGQTSVAWNCATGAISSFCSTNERINGFNPVRLRVYSPDPGVTFAGMLYAQNTLAEGYAINLGYNAVNVSGDAPDYAARLGYRINLEANFSSGTGEDFTPSCGADIITEFQLSSEQMVTRTNARIGNIVCPGKDVNEIKMLTVSSSVVFNGNVGTTVNGFRLDVKGNIQLDEIQSCATEVGVYLRDQLNWPQPIIPDIPGCAPVRFDSTFFTQTEEGWVCPESLTAVKARPLSVRTPELKYRFSTDGLLNASDIISASCILDYEQALTASTDSQVVATNPDIGVGLCSGMTIQIESASVGMAASGSDAYSTQNFFLNPPATMALNDVYQCGQEVSSFLQQHSNWQQPIIPPQDGCPNIEYNPQQFFDNGQQWYCA